MKLFFVRHGETESNALGKTQGQRVDGSLNEKGKQQAAQLADEIREMQFDAIFSSPLKRAHETAVILSAGRNTSILLRDELKEKDFGDLSGKTWPEMETGDALRKIDKELRYNYRPYGGESVEDVRKRLLHFIEEMKKAPEKRILVVAHSGIIRLMHHDFKETLVSHVGHAAIEEFDV